jgi:predicted nucleic acid-binding protein
VTIGELCRRHHRIGLDTNVFIYLLEDRTGLASVSQALIDAIESGVTRGVLATIGLAEMAIGPARSGDAALVERYAYEIAAIPGLRIDPLTPDLAIEAAIVRGTRGVGLADAIHLATARASGATAFVTNDRSLRGSRHLAVVYLDELETEAA